MRILSTLKGIAAAVILSSIATVQSASALPVSIVDYAVTANPGIQAEITSGGVFQTLGGVSVESLLNFANFLPVADQIGKVSISNVSLTGAAFALAPNVYSQSTVGGRIEVLDNANSLLLSVDFTSGLLTLATNGTGGQFTVGTATFGGSLASLFLPTSATHSISLINWAPVQLVSGQRGLTFAASTGFGNGLIAGEQAVPEPATMLLLGSGVLGAAIRRRKAA